MKKINYTIYNNFDFDFNEYKEFYQEAYELTDEEMSEVSDYEVYEFISDNLNDAWNDTLCNLKNSRFGGSPCVITGTLGLWHGRPTIAPVCCNNIVDAINKCVDNMDYIILKQMNGHLEVTGIHHDGRNCFEIHLLNDKGVKAMNNINEGWGSANVSLRTYHKAIDDFIF